MQNGPDITSYFWLILAASVVTILARRIRAPYALTLVIVGLLIGSLRLLPTVRLDPHVLFTVFLPPLLFESAIHLRFDALRREWKPISLLAIGVTIVSTFIVASLASCILHLPLPDALIFGALISATDPISVIAVFKQLGASPRLTLLMDAEALFNDGVAVVLFTVFLHTALGGNFSILSSVGLFLLNALGGIVAGGIIGYAVSHIARLDEDPLLAIKLTTLAAFGSYLGADALNVSGVLSVITAGLVVGNYGMPNSMSPATRGSVSAFWEYAAFAVNSIVFLIVGIEEASADLLHHLPMAIGGALIVLSGRLAVYPISWIANRVGSDIPARFRHILFWGGLRGALSMALALGLPANFPERGNIVAATFGAVLFSLLIQGLTVGGLLKRLGLVAPVTPA